MRKKHISPQPLPQATFDILLENSVIPTFDLIIQMPEKKVLIVNRKILPYKTWALPGLRMFRDEEVDNVLTRIAEQEVGLQIDTSSKKIIGQYKGTFPTRQDISTCYAVTPLNPEDLAISDKHFSGYRLIGDASEIPPRMGAMYRHYLNIYFEDVVSKATL